MRKLFLLVGAILISAPAYAGVELFSDSRPLALEIKADYPELVKNNFAMPLPVFAGALLWEGQSLGVQVEARGKTRRGICPSLPPLKITLPKGKRPFPFGSMDRDLKFVTSCKPAPDEGDKVILLREYTQYLMLEAAGFRGFKVRLVEVTYRNLDGSEYGKGLGFFIENIKDFAKRNELSTESPVRAFRDQEAELVVAEILLANADFSVPNPPDTFFHNIKAYRNAKNELLAMVPYDFDLTSLSRAPNWPSEAAQLIDTYLIRRNKLPAALPYLKRVIEHREQILAAINASPLNEFDKKAFADRVEIFCQTAAGLLAD